jgi:hypothetical protein
MIPVGMVAERVAIEPGVIEIVQTVEILRRELVVSKLVVAKLIVGRERVTTSVCEIVTGNPSSITGHCVIVTDIMGSELMTVAVRGMTSKSVCMDGVSRKAVSAQCMATPPMPHVGQAPAGSKPMKPTAAAQSMGSMPTPAAKPMPTPAAKSTPTPTANTATTATLSGECGGVRHHAERANRNACCQNTYRFLLHGAFLNAI